VAILPKRSSKPATDKPASKPAHLTGRKENLRPNNRGTRKPANRKRGNLVDMTKFCTELAQRHSVTAASRASGINKRFCYEMMRSKEFPEVYNSALQEVARRAQDDSIVNYKLETGFVDNLVAKKLLNHRTHEKVGDMDFAKLSEVTYKRLGLIQPAHITATAHGGNAVAMQATTFRQRYKSMWLVRKEAEMLRQIEAEEAQKALPATNGPDPTPTA